MKKRLVLENRIPGVPDFLSQSVEESRTFYYKKSTPMEGVSIVCGGREFCSPHYSIDREHFPYLCLEWVAAGKGELLLGGRPYSLRPGSFFLYGPGIPHRIATDPRDRLVKYFIDFTGPGALALLKKNRLKVPECRLLPPGIGMLEIFDRLVETSSLSSPSNHRLLRLLLECLFVLASASYPDSGTLQGRAYQTYLRCRSYMEQNIRSLHRIENVAEACHLDPAYLTRVFRRFAGESPHRFLTSLKMNAAALQLVRREMLVKEVAGEFGFADPYHFSKTFKKVHGLSPEAYLRTKR
jgi:AraC-like DNA-binding protein